MATCKNCGNTLILNNGKCLYCGLAPNGQVPDRGDEPANPINKCPVCGTPQPAGVRFCNNCGAPMSGNGTQKTDLPLRIEYGNVFCTMENYSGPLDIPNYIDGQKVVAIGECAFMDVPISSVVIPDTVTTIGQGAFANCNNLIELVLPNSVVSIQNYAFQLCGNLRHVVIPNSVRSIGEAAFHGCKSLSDIVIPPSVETIGNAVFLCCCLKSVTIPKKLWRNRDEILMWFKEDESLLPKIYDEYGNLLDYKELVKKSYSI